MTVCTRFLDLCSNSAQSSQRAPSSLHVFRSGSNTTSELDGNTHISHGHLTTRQGSEQRELVDVAHVANPEDLASHLHEAAAEREVVLLVCSLHNLLSIIASGNTHGGDSIRVLGWIVRARFQSPRLHGQADTLGESVVSLPHVLHTFLQKHSQRLLEPVEKRGGRRVREIPDIVVCYHVLPREKDTRALRRFADLEGLL
mmetsp:Transcript_6742/g.20427  ORF Transcript_6742/g.20427 Transcript_6742/m.20427 type:complete len:200 (-) Transcript_6742:726-1325(-)